MSFPRSLLLALGLSAAAAAPAAARPKTHTHTSPQTEAPPPKSKPGPLGRVIGFGPVIAAKIRIRGHASEDGPLGFWSRALQMGWQWFAANHARGTREGAAASAVDAMSHDAPRERRGERKGRDERDLDSGIVMVQ